MRAVLLKDIKVIGVVVNQFVEYAEVLYYLDGLQHLEVFDNDELLDLKEVFDEQLYDL